MPSTKISKQVFLKKYPKYVSQGMTQGEMAECFGVSRRTLIRYINKWGDDAKMTQVQQSYDETALEIGEQEANKVIRIALERILNTIERLDEWGQRIEEKEYTDNYFLEETEDGARLRFPSQFKKDEYVLNQVKSATREAKSLLDVAKTIFKKEQVVNALQVNIHNDSRQLRVDPDFFKEAFEERDKDA